jgi:hypothetical protein
MEVGFMLADEAAPTDPAERLALFVQLAKAEWYSDYDPEQIRVTSTDPEPYVDEAEYSHRAGPGDTPTSHWYVFYDLHIAEGRG